LKEQLSNTGALPIPAYRYQAEAIAAAVAFIESHRAIFPFEMLMVHAALSAGGFMSHASGYAAKSASNRSKQQRKISSRDVAGKVGLERQ